MQTWNPNWDVFSRPYRVSRLKISREKTEYMTFQRCDDGQVMEGFFYEVSSSKRLRNSYAWGQWFRVSATSMPVSSTDLEQVGENAGRSVESFARKLKGEFYRTLVRTIPL